MGLVFFILLFALTIILLAFLIDLKIKLVFNSEKSDIKMSLLWLSPLIKAFVSMKNSLPILNIYLFNRLVLKKTIKRRNKKSRDMNLVQLVNPRDIHVDVQYGFKDPFETGIACGVINIASQFINIDSIKQTPDFVSTDDYIYLDATAKVNLGTALVNFFKSRSRNKNPKIL